MTASKWTDRDTAAVFPLLKEVELISAENEPRPIDVSTGGETPAEPSIPNAENQPAVPNELAILPLRGVVVYPLTAVPLTVGQPRSVKLIDDAAVGQRIIGLVTAKDPELETPGPDDLHRVGTAALVHRLFRAPDGTIRLLVQGLARFRVGEFTQTEPYLKARIELAPEVNEKSLGVEALMRNISTLFQRLGELVPSMPAELLSAALSVEDPLQFVYTIALYQRMDLADAQNSAGAGHGRREDAAAADAAEQRSGSAGAGPQDPDRGPGRDGKDPARLLPARADEGHPARTGRRRRADGGDRGACADGWPRRACPKRPTRRPTANWSAWPSCRPAAAEYGVIRTYLDWLISLPWHKTTDDNLDVQPCPRRAGRRPLRAERRQGAHPGIPGRAQAARPERRGRAPWHEADSQSNRRQRTTTSAASARA